MSMLWFIVFGLITAVLVFNYFIRRSLAGRSRVQYDYDVIIVGGGIAGPVMAKALSDQNRKVLLLERSLFTKPDRIVGELLQPGGINALRQVQMDDCAARIGTPCNGYLLIDDEGGNVTLPYKKGFQGCSFHFGDFVNNLRSYVWHNCVANVTMLEATVNEVLVDNKGYFEQRAYGVEYSIDADYRVPETPFVGALPADHTSREKIRRVALAPLIIMCDGGVSKFKARYEHYTPARKYHSNFIGLILRNVKLPQENHGTVFFSKTGPVLSYRLDPGELRVLIDYNKPTLPNLEKQSRWLIENVAPSLPMEMRASFISAAEDVSNIRSMPIARCPASFPSIKGYVGIGDHSNQRHPLTGGGMTCAFNDALLLAKKLESVKVMRSKDRMEMTVIEDCIQQAVLDYTRRRVFHSSCINILSWALYAVFGSKSLRNSCLDYFLRGEDCVDGPMGFLSGLDPSPIHLIRHYYKVMYYGALSLVTCNGKYSCRTTVEPDFSTKLFNALTFFLNPYRFAEAICIFFSATCVIVPLVYCEFASIWQLIDPTSLFARFIRTLKVMLYCSFFDGKNGKPIGL